ncbi:MAG: hypothetical protein Kow00121_50810 [Elainellaceae cyanobacterium]
MTSENSQIQTLIRQIDEVLSKTNPRLPWVMSNDAVQQRQVLEQTRNYLLESLQQSKTPEAPPTMPLASEQSSQSVAAVELSAQQALQAVVQEMNLLRTNMLQPLRSDMEVLRLQREALLQEVRQLEMQRQQYQMSQQNSQYITEFLQAAMAQMQENLSGQMAQMLATLSAQPNSQRLEGTSAQRALGASGGSLGPVERLEQLQMVQAQSDQLLMRLDTTLRVVFESLQRNLQSYGDSLEEGLGRMHDMGQQGEAVFGAFVTRLAQILGREASSFLQTPVTDASWVADRPSLPSQEAAEQPDAQISRLLEELNALDQSAVSQPAAGEPVPFNLSQLPPELAPEEELENLEQLDRELSQLDLSAIPGDLQVIHEEELLDDDQVFPFPPLDEAALNPNYPISIEVSSIPMADSPPTDADLESALDLLNQITTETSDRAIEDNQESEGTPAETASSLEPPQTNLVSTPEALYGDEFYQSLFGDNEANAEPSPGSHSITEASPPDLSQSGLSQSDLSQSDLSQSGLSQSGLSQPEAESPPPIVDAEDTIGSDLFAGLAEAPEAEWSQDSEILPIIEPAATDLPQSVENLLLQPPAAVPAPDSFSLDDFFAEPEPEPEPAASQPIDTITSLIELIPSESELEPTSSTVSQADRVTHKEAGGEVNEEYEPALPGEDLLAPEQATVPIANFQLPAETLQQLTQDLSNLEDRSNEPLSVAESEWTLADWAELQSNPAPAADSEFGWEDEGSALSPTSDASLDDCSLEDLLFTDDFAGSAPQRSAPGSKEEMVEAETTSATGTPPPASESKFAAANELLESTIEDWFATVDTEPTVTPEAPKQAESQSQSATNDASLFDWGGDSDAAETDANAFTLEGLDSLFEGVPPTEPTPRPHLSGTDTQTITINDVFGDVDSSDEASDQPPPSESAKKKE